MQSLKKEEALSKSDNNVDQMKVRAPQETPQTIPNEPDADHCKHDNSTKTGQLLLTLRPQISSSSASFFDEVDSDSNGIPSPPYKFSSKEEDFVANKQEQREPEQKEQLPPLLQNSRQPLELQEQRQDPQQEQRLEADNEEENDENSGDSKNHDLREGIGAIGKRLSLLKDKKKKKTQEANSSTNVTDEEWLNDLGTPLAKTEYTTMASLQVDQQHTHAQALTMPSNRGMDPLCDAFRDGVIGPGSPTLRSNNSSKSSRNALLNMKNNDPVRALSMEYSQDDSTMIGEKSVGEYTFDSTLLGQNFAADSKSVLTVATKETLVTKDVLEEVPEDTQHTHSSIGAGSSYTTVDDEPVPSDEELFAAGWAKAMDSNSGYYYYFTLDRKRTVWDNPLAPPMSPTNCEGSSVGEI